VIVGGGSTAFAAALRAAELGARATIINDGLPIGGTCVNVGCVPSKTLLRAAETVHKSNQNPFFGIDSGTETVDFATVMAEKTALVEALRQRKYLDVVADHNAVDIVEGRAAFVDKKTVEVNGERIEGDKILIATGVRPYAPPIPGLADTPYLTNESAFELTACPESMIVLGGRYVALEIAQMFARFGTKVTVLQRSARILPDQTADLTDALTGYLRAEGVEIITGVALAEVGYSQGFTVHADVDGTRRTFQAAQLLAATGRTPNTDDLGLENAGVATDARGFVTVASTLQTSQPDIYAAGDVIGEPQFVYVSAYEGGLAASNAIGGAQTERDYTTLPWVIFTDPQVAGVGLDEAQAAAAGLEVDTAVLPLSHVPRAIAARDTRGFIKLIREPATDLLVGARILAPEGSELLMEAALAIKHKLPVAELRNAFHPYLTLAEGMKLAAITFGKSVDQLSCCAT